MAKFVNIVTITEDIGLVKALAHTSMYNDMQLVAALEEAVKNSLYGSAYDQVYENYSYYGAYYSRITICVEDEYGSREYDIAFTRDYMEPWRVSDIKLTYISMKERMPLVIVHDTEEID